MLRRLRSAKLPEARAVRPFIEVEHEGARHRVAVKRVATARRISLRVRAARHDVVLTMPTRGSFAAAERFVHRHAAWIADRLGALAPPIPFVPGCRIPLRGELHVAVHRPSLRRHVWIDTKGDEAQLCLGGRAADFAPMLMAYLHQQARADLTAAVGRFAAQAGVTVKTLTVRDTRSRWGSCSSQGALNFSWRLILAPTFVLEYLAAHEVAHRVHLDHSADFWALVRRLYPEIERAEDWLKLNGAALHRFGAPRSATITNARSANDPCSSVSGSA